MKTQVNSDLCLLNVKIILLSCVFNPGPILVGLALYGIALEKMPFGIILDHSLANYFALVLGVVLLLVNFFYVSKLAEKRKVLKSAVAERA